MSDAVEPLPWTIVIPSYNRAKTLRLKTLAFLQQHLIPKERIHVVVANEEQAVLYRAEVGESVGKILVGVKGLTHVRNWIFNHYSVGAPLVCIDDDIRGMIEYDEQERRCERPVRDLIGIFERGFSEARAAKARLWGMYPCANGFFMKPEVSTSLRYIIGSFWGCFNPGSEIQLPIGDGEKEDYQRTILFWEADGVVVRLNFVSAKTAYYTEPGGLQDGNRLAKTQEVVKEMLARWPHLLVERFDRKSGFPEFRLVSPRSKVSRRQE
jgi:hypothetical protein